MTPTTVPTWRSILRVAAAAMAVVLAGDLVARWQAPPILRREVADALREYHGSDPVTVVLGSSHARTFTAVRDSLAARTEGAHHLVAVPVEFGKFTSYRWVLKHRLRPLIEERSPSGALIRPSLRRFILLTEWWDGCATPDGAPPTNVPSRGWTLTHFLADVWNHGLTAYNRNYLQQRWRRLWRVSALVQDRGHQRTLLALRHRLAPLSPAADSARAAAFLQGWQRMIENGNTCIGDREQLAALDDILAYVDARGLDLTIILFPRKPETVTARARATTLPRFATMVDSLRPPGSRLIDLTLTTPLDDGDFMEDFDHVSQAGNAKFAGWALDNGLKFLLQGGVERARYTGQVRETSR